MATDTTNRADLLHVLDGIAERIAIRGTHSERAVLGDLAAAVRPHCAGAADALVDWDGAEVARLRAFGVVHGVLCRQVVSRPRAEPIMLAV